MLLAEISKAAGAASGSEGLFHGYPPWLVVLLGAFLAALALWLFGKLLKWVIWLVIILVLAGGIIVAVRMFFESR
ncbi:hypothetical protein [Opitutus sp. ER46]|uniref:hypothetical protein n=1 Tax=Opitutus sp. ER46 TaxID=2161864 RepID=UPI000D325561|nr:hypothetical protein [Opitutus sp. ER46]PTX92731.1 hypothetical protein DB354_15540 [Opitutus sp. ER46]